MFASSIERKEHSNEHRTHSRHRIHRQDRQPHRQITDEKGFPVREGSRSATIPFDWEHPETWAAALEGVRPPMFPISPISPFRAPLRRSRR
jgi:hypothetical protein